MKHLKMLAKSLSWRGVSLFITLITSYVITGQIWVALTIGGMDFFIKFVVFYLHEVVWKSKYMKKTWSKIYKKSKNDNPQIPSL